MESTSYVLSFRVVFFYLVATGWIFDISLRDNSINSINHKRAVGKPAAKHFDHSFIQMKVLLWRKKVVGSVFSYLMRFAGKLFLTMLALSRSRASQIGW